jgi:hypothetical protein
MSMSLGVTRLFASALSVLVCAFALAVPLAQAKTVDTKFKDVRVTFTKVNAGDPNATSAYVKFEGGLTKFNAEVRADDFTVTPLGAGGEFQLTAKAGKSIPDGGTLTLRVRTTAGTLKGVRIGDVIFQDGNMKPLANGMATGGALVGDPVYTLHNDLESSADLMVTNLHFYFSHALVDWETLDPATPITGSFFSAEDALLTGMGSFKDYTVPNIDDGKAFLVQGEVMSNGIVVARFVDGFEVSVVPEPATALLLAGGLLAVAARQRRRNGGRHALAA